MFGRSLFLIVLLTALSQALYAQQNFEKGYIVDNAQNKTGCWLRNVGSAESAESYQYRLSPQGEILDVSLAKISEFGIENELKCVRALIAVDTSPERIARVEDAKKGPEWDEGHAYLKVLVDGKLATLYSYFSEGEELFYFNTGSSAIQPLYHKEYNLEITPGIVENKIVDNTFREQLKKDMSCGEAEELETLAYTKKALIRYFEYFYKCKKTEYSVPGLSKHQKGRFALKVGASFNQMKMSALGQAGGGVSLCFSDENSVGFGAEAEYVFGFNNHKWSVFAETNYYSYYSDYSDYQLNVGHEGYVADYKTIEFPFGINHYMYLNPDNRFFVKVAYVPHFILNNSGVILGADYEYDFASVSRTFVGVGYNYKRLSCEARFYSAQNITQNLHQWETDYSQMSFRLSYTLFNTK